VAPSGECLRGKSPHDRMLATLAPPVSGSLLVNLVVVAVLRDSRVIGCSPA